jgi:hypothetical protein
VNQTTRRVIARTIGKPFDSYALQLLGFEQNDALPWTSSAPRPGLLSCLINDIRINRRSRIVEFGSGVSTLVIAKALDPEEQKMITFEHDREWANLVTEQLMRHGLADRCQVVHAPLVPCEQSIDGSSWYDTATIRESVGSLDVDVVVCDGPPAYSTGSRMARYPAIPVLRHFLSDRYSVYLDDIDRSGEREIAKKWSELLQIPFSYQLLRGSFAVGFKGEHYNALI